MKTALSGVPIDILEKVHKLPADQRAEFWAEYNSGAKTTTVGYLLWLIGLHYLYVGKLGTEILYLITLGGFFIWAIIDFFRMPSIINEYNRKVSEQALRNAKWTATENNEV